MADFYDGVVNLKLLQFPTGDVDIVNVGENGSPLLSTIAGMGRDKLEGEFTALGLREKFWNKGVTYTFFEYDDYPSLFQINGAIASAVIATWVLDSNAGLVVGSVLQNITTGEQVRVTAVNVDGVTITVTRGFGTVAAANVADDQKLLLVSTSTAYGVTGSDAVELTPVQQDNYFQKVTRTIKRTDFSNFIQNELSNLTWENVTDKRDVWLQQNMKEHAKQIEKAILFSQKKADNTNRIYAVEGLYRMAVRGGQGADISGGATLAAFSTALASMYRKGNTKVKYGFYGSSCNAVLQAMVATNAQYAQGVYRVGELNLSFSKLTLIGGQEIYLMQHPYMNANSGLEKKLLVIDPDELKIVYANGADMLGAPIKGTTQMHELTDRTNYANQEWDIVTYFSLHNANSQAHGVVTLAA